VLSLVLALTLSAEPLGIVHTEPLSGETFALVQEHKFPKPDARARVQMMLEYWKKAFDVAFVWVGERAWLEGKVWGVTFHAFIDVTDDKVSGEAIDPGGMRGSMAKSYIVKKLKKYLHPTYEEP
jgi:hypothetical protein